MTAPKTSTSVESGNLVRLPSLERGCKDKIKLGHKGYARNAERMAKKLGLTGITARTYRQLETDHQTPECPLSSDGKPSA